MPHALGVDSGFTKRLEVGLVCSSTPRHPLPFHGDFGNQQGMRDVLTPAQTESAFIVHDGPVINNISHFFYSNARWVRECWRLQDRLLSTKWSLAMTWWLRPLTTMTLLNGPSLRIQVRDLQYGFGSRTTSDILPIVNKLDTHLYPGIVYTPERLCQCWFIYLLIIIL